MNIQSPKGQNVIEYVLLVFAVTTVMIIFLSRGGKMEEALNNSVQGLVTGVHRIEQSLEIPNAE